MSKRSPISSNYSSLQRVKDNFSSLLWESLGVFVIFVVVLIITSGKPSEKAISLTFLIAGGFVIFAEIINEQKRNRRNYDRPKESGKFEETEAVQLPSNQDQQRVTLYLPVDLYHQLKMQSDIEQESMSDLAEKALMFYLSHSDTVEGVLKTYNTKNPSRNITVGRLIKRSQSQISPNFGGDSSKSSPKRSPSGKSD